MPAQVIPIADGGHGAFTWDLSHVVANTYRIRCGALTAARVILDPHLPSHPQILDGFCAVLDQHEGEHQP